MVMSSSSQSNSWARPMLKAGISTVAGQGPFDDVPLALATAALATDPDLLVINRFGKTEAEGGGVRPLIADAVDRGIPVLIAVPWRNIASWRVFAGELAVEFGFGDLPVDPAAACRLLGLAPPADRHPAGVASATSEPAPPS